MDYLEAAPNDDNEISDALFKFRALIGHQGPFKPTDPNWKGCKYNVIVDCETGEKTYEPLSVLAADAPVTCAMYAKASHRWVEKVQEPCKKGQDPNRGCNAIEN